MSFTEFSHGDQVCSVPVGEHFVQVYDSDKVLIESLFAFLLKGFDTGEGAVVIATRTHRAALEKQFMGAGFDLGALKRSGKYAPFDAAETLGLFMRNGKPDATLFFALAGGLIKSAAAGRAGVRTFGEMVSILWDEGNREGAIELEGLWNELGKKHAFTLFCAYREDQFVTGEKGIGLGHVCHAHSSVVFATGSGMPKLNAAKSNAVIASL